MPLPRTPELPSERVGRELRELVAGLDHGQQVPTVRELAERYDVSTETVRRVLAVMEAEGLVIIRARWGAFRA
jgi:GntR family transcriptional regulator